MQKTQKPKHNSPFTIDPTGHYVSSKDGFVVPKDFAEFYGRYPNYVTSWVFKHIQPNYRKNPADAQDWVSELTIHLMALPERSTKRKDGHEDVISCFDPARLRGANSKSFFFYINTCLRNRFIEHLHKKRKDAIRDALRNAPNLSFEQSPQLEDEHCGIQPCQDMHSSMRAGEFKDFVGENEPGLLPAVETIFCSETIKEAAGKMGMTVYQFRPIRSRLKVLFECFEAGLPVPKKKSPRRKKKGRAATGLPRPARSPRRTGRIGYPCGSWTGVAGSPGSAASAPASASAALFSPTRFVKKRPSAETPWPPSNTARMVG